MADLMAADLTVDAVKPDQNLILKPGLHEIGFFNAHPSLLRFLARPCADHRLA